MKELLILRQRTYMNTEPYTIFWRVFGPDSLILMPLAQGGMHYYELTEDTSFPVYISGSQLELFEQDGYESLDVGVLNMVAGALLGCRPPRPHFPLHGPDDLRPLLSDYLGRYSKELGHESLEDFVLELSSVLRDKNGSAASAQALKNSEYLRVDFSRILNDLLLDLWDMLSTIEDENLLQAFREFNDYLTRVKPENMHPESIAWYHFARTVTLLLFEVQQPGSVRQKEWSETLASNENPKLRNRLEHLWQEKRFDRRLL
jgi:hypothetical protein